MAFSEFLILLVGAILGSFGTYLFQKIFHLENVIPHEIAILNQNILSSRSRMIEETILNRQLDAYFQIQVLATSLVKASINAIDDIQKSPNIILSDHIPADNIFKKLDMMTEVVDGYQFILPESIHQTMIPFFRAVRHLIGTIKEAPPVDREYAEHQRIRSTALEDVKKAYKEIGPRLKKMHAPVLEALDYKLPNVQDYDATPEKLITS